jgi:hypothetical protein
MKNDFEYRSYYYMNTEEAYPFKGSHVIPVTFMGQRLNLRLSHNFVHEIISSFFDERVAFITNWAL